MSNHLQKLPDSAWIKTTEALPQAAHPDERFVRCLAYPTTAYQLLEKVQILVFDLHEKHWADDDLHEFVCCWDAVSHWMPVPADPKADDQA